MSEPHPIPLLFRIILAPLYWPKLVLGARFLPVEESIFAAVLTALSAAARAVVESQLREVNYISRSSIENTEIVLQKLYVFSGGTLKRDRVLPLDGEIAIASADLTWNDSPSAHAEVWSVQGVVFMVKFDKKVNLRRRPLTVSCKINPVVTGAVR